MQNLGIVKPGSTLVLNFDTFDGGTGAPITMTDFVVGDIEIYKDVDFVNQRSSDTGYALVDDGIDVDAITGVHAYSVDLSSNADAGFYACGSHYSIRIGPVTIDAQTVNFWHAEFTIGQPNAILNTTITSITDQDTFVIDKGPAEADALNGCVVLIQDVASDVQMGFAVVTDYLVTSRTVQLLAGPTLTLAATDSISFFPPVNTAWMGNGASVAQTGNDVGADVNLILADTGTDGVVLAANAITEAKIADNAIATEHIATGAITADSIAADAIGSSEFAASAVNKIWDSVAAATVQGAPSTTPTLEVAIMTIYDALVHAVDVTATLKAYKNNAGTVIWKKALSDDATTYTEAESASGPA